jgi:mRNA interferase RelE/StbE
VAYKVLILPAALRQLADLSRADQRRISDKIERLEVDPRPPAVKCLQGKREYLRLRSGDYRIVYTVDDDRQGILIVAIGHRREVYRAL